MASVYSVLLGDFGAVTPAPVVVVPASANVQVVRFIAVVNNGTVEDQLYVYYTSTGSTIAAFDITPTTTGFAAMDLRAVIPPGESLTANSTYGPWNINLSGYSLTP